MHSRTVVHKPVFSWMTFVARDAAKGRDEQLQDVEDAAVNQKKVISRRRDVTNRNFGHVTPPPPGCASRAALAQVATTRAAAGLSLCDSVCLQSCLYLEAARK